MLAMKSYLARLRKYNWKWLRSSVIVLVVLCLVFVMIFAIPASAAKYTTVDYNDYITDVAVSGDMDIVSVKFDYKDFFWAWNEPSFASNTGYNRLADGGYIPYTGRETAFKNYPVIDLDFKDTSTVTDLIIRPLGFSVIDLSDIPNGTTIKSESFLYFYNLPYPQGVGYDFYTVEFTLQYCDENGIGFAMQKFSSESGDVTTAYGWKVSYAFSGDIDKPDGAVYAMPRIVVNFHISSDDDYQAEIVSSPLTMDLSISSMYRLQQETKKTNNLLSAIQHQNQTIIDQNQTIIDGTPEQNAAADKFESNASDAVSDMEQISDDMAAVTTPEVNVQDLVPNDVLMGTHFLTYVDALNNFWDCKEIVVILTILASLLLIGVVLHGKKGW